MMRAPSPLSRMTLPRKGPALTFCRNSIPSMPGMFRSQTITFADSGSACSISKATFALLAVLTLS